MQFITTCFSTESRNCSRIESPLLYKRPESFLSAEVVPQVHNFSKNLQTFNNNTELINFTDNITNATNKSDDPVSLANDNKQIGEINSNHIPEPTTGYASSENLNLTDNYTHKLNQLEDFKCPEYFINKNQFKNNKNQVEIFKKAETYIEENLNCSTNSLVSDNLSSPMQTSTDVFLDSEIFSTDAASNDSHSPKNTQVISEKKSSHQSLIELKRFNDFCLSYKNSASYASNENFSNLKSDQSLLNSSGSCDSSPSHKINREYKKVSKKHKIKKHFGVKTLQNIFNRRDGYSDISSTASEFGDEIVESNEVVDAKAEDLSDKTKGSDESPSLDVNSQFEENIHQFLSETFSKSFALGDQSSIMINKSTGSKKYFKLNGQNLRIGKALRLCPNDEISDNTTSSSKSDNKKEKLLARYVYNSNLFSADGIGDPDFGTPV